MAENRSPMPFEKTGNKNKQSKLLSNSTRNSIPEYVSRRIIRRIFIFTGLPSAGGMGIFVGSYVLVTKEILDIPPSVTLLTSGIFFLLGLAGLTYAMLSASWEYQAGSLLGIENLKPNYFRFKESIREKKKSIN